MSTCPRCNAEHLQFYVRDSAAILVRVEACSGLDELIRCSDGTFIVGEYAPLQSVLADIGKALTDREVEE